MNARRPFAKVSGADTPLVKAQMDAGNYTDDSDYIRDLIRREQERSAETEMIRADGTTMMVEVRPTRLELYGHSLVLRLCQEDAKP